MKRNRLNSNRGSRTEMGENSRGAPAAHKDVKNEGRSGNVYENKEPGDNLPDTKDDISRQLHAILHGSYTYPPEIGGPFVTVRALGNESLASNVETRGMDCRKALQAFPHPV